MELLAAGLWISGLLPAALRLPRVATLITQPEGGKKAQKQLHILFIFLIFFSEEVHIVNVSLDI